MKFIATICALLSIALAASSARAEGGWKMPSLNPFKKAGPPTSARVSDGSGFKMPKLWPSSGSIVKRQSGPTTWQKFKSGTKSVWSKTPDVLNPFDDAQDKQEPIQITGSNSFVSQASNRKDSAKKSSTCSPMGCHEDTA